jgi:hypothetical protein
MSEDNAVLIPASGEVLDLNGPMETFVSAWEQLAELEADLKATKRAISDEIAERLDHEGRRSIEVDGVRFEVSAPTVKLWDVPLLQENLSELVDEGVISDEKAGRCIKWEPSPVWNEIRTLLSDPRCSRLEHVFELVPATRYVKVRR